MSIVNPDSLSCRQISTSFTWELLSYFIWWFSFLFIRLGNGEIYFEDFCTLMASNTGRGAFAELTEQVCTCSKRISNAEQCNILLERARLVFTSHLLANTRHFTRMCIIMFLDKPQTGWQSSAATQCWRSLFCASRWCWNLCTSGEHARVHGECFCAVRSGVGTLVAQWPGRRREEGIWVGLDAREHELAGGPGERLVNLWVNAKRAFLCEGR